MNRRENLETPPSWSLRDDCEAFVGAPVVKRRFRLWHILRQLFWSKERKKANFDAWKKAKGLRALEAQDTATVCQALANPHLAEEYDWLLVFSAWQECPPICFRTIDLVKHPHVFLGFDFETGNPVLLSIEILKGHGVITGASGTGKTANGVNPLVYQIMLRGEWGIIFIDLKGSRSLFNTLKHAAKDIGYEFKWFTTRADRSTYSFNPLLQPGFMALSFEQQAALVASALGLNYGEGYGEGFYSEVNLQVLRSVFKEYGRAGVPIRSLIQLRDILNLDITYHGDKKLKTDSLHLRMAVDLLADIPQLNVTEDGEFPEQAAHAIKIAEMLGKRCLAYFDLPVSLSPQQARDSARFLSVLSLAESQQEYSKSGSGKPLFLVISEFQEVVGPESAAMFEMGRESQLFILADHQSVSQLKKPNGDFRKIAEMARYRRSFSVENGSDDARAIIEASGETIVPFYGDTEADGANSNGRSWNDSWSSSEKLLTRWGANELNQVNSEINLSIVRINNGHGFSNFGGAPFVLFAGLQLNFKLVLEDPWPEKIPGTLVANDTIAPTKLLTPGTDVEARGLELARANGSTDPSAFAKQIKHNTRRARQKATRKKHSEAPGQSAKSKEPIQAELSAILNSQMNLSKTEGR